MASEETNDQTLLNTLVGQAAAGITLAVAFIYGAGALTIALRLYFTRLPWESVVGQMPNYLIITTGFGQVVLLAVIIGILGAVLLNFLVNQSHDSGRSFTRLASRRVRCYLQEPPGLFHALTWLLVAMALGAAEAAISLYNYVNHRNAEYITLRNGRNLPDHFTISPARYFISVAILCAIAAGIALILLPTPRESSDTGVPGDNQNGGLSQGSNVVEQVPKLKPANKRQGLITWQGLSSVIALALLRMTCKSSDTRVADSKQASDDPSQAAGAANRVQANPRPPSKLSPWEWKAVVAALITFAAIPGIAAFSASTLFPYTLACSTMFKNGQLSADLIATNGGWAYTIQYNVTNKSGQTDINSYFSVIPLSSVQLVAMGSSGNCNDLESTTMTALVSSANPSVAGARVTYTATVSLVPDGGMVAFTDGTTTIAGCGAKPVNTTTGVATCQTTPSTTGAHNIVAAFSGSSRFAGSTSATLTQVLTRTPCRSLAGCNLSGLNLTNAHLSGADLSGADLSGADLSGADLSGANLNKATWSGTTCPDGTNSDADGGTCTGHL